MSKLTREDKIEIYERRKNGETIPSLAKAFNVQESNIKYLIALIKKHGYNNMVVDMRSLLEMRKFNYPVVFDVTHAVQKPGGLGTATSGDREYVYPLLRAGLAIGVDAIFAEVHPNPTEAKSDGPNMLYLKDLEEILKTALEIDKIVKGV